MKKINGVHISEHKGHKEMSLKNDLVFFTNPEYVYIPLVEQGAPCEVNVAVGDEVKLGQVVATKTGRFSLPMHSPVSGKVTAVDKKMWHASGKMVPCIEISNDFLETKDPSIHDNEVEKLSKEDIVNIMKNCGLVGLGGASFPTYVKYSGNAKIDYLLINAAECEPYITNDYTIITRDDMRKKLIRGIKYALKASGASQAVIAIKKTKVHAIELLNDAIKDEPMISVFGLNDVYPAGWEKYIVQAVTKKTYNALPSEAGCIVNNVATLVSLCDAVEHNMPLVEKLVTLTGKGLKNPCVMYTKIGSKISDCVKSIGGYVDGLVPSNTYLIAGGPMTGKAIMFDTLVINRSFGDIIVMPKEERVNNPRCMGCGKCVDNCPTNLSPILIKKALEAKNMQLLSDLNATRCMQCGLCSYICPSRIELTEAVGKAKAALLKK